MKSPHERCGARCPHDNGPHQDQPAQGDQQTPATPDIRVWLHGGGAVADYPISHYQDKSETEANNDQTCASIVQRQGRYMNRHEPTLI